MFYSSKRKQLLSEGMSLDQIKQGLNSDLLRMLKNFKNTVFNVEGRINHPEIKKFMRSQQVKALEPNHQFKKHLKIAIVLNIHLMHILIFY